MDGQNEQKLGWTSTEGGNAGLPYGGGSLCFSLLWLDRILEPKHLLDTCLEIGKNRQNPPGFNLLSKIYILILFLFW